MTVVGEVLIAAYRTDSGMVTIMHDLTNSGYKILKPKEEADLYVLWEAFSVLVKSVLVPMADARIIHPDIRPGWDDTANILVRMGANGKPWLEL